MTTQPKTFFDTIGSFFTSGSRFQATGTSSPTELPTILPTEPVLPIPPQYILNSGKEDNMYYNNTQEDNMYYNNNMNSQINNLEKKYKNRLNIYFPQNTQSSQYDYGTKSFLNRTNANDIYPNKPRTENFTNMNEEIFLKKIKNDNKQIENVALSFVTILILVFLLVIFNSIRNKK
jgi:hypothetical protein